MGEENRPFGIYCTSFIVKNGIRTEIREFISFEHGIDEVHKQADDLALKVQKKVK